MSESSTSIQEDYARDKQTKKVLKVQLFYAVQLQRMRHVNAVDGVIGILGQLIHVGEYGRVIEDALRDAEEHAFDLQEHSQHESDDPKPCGCHEPQCEGARWRSPCRETFRRKTTA
jgi:hypothetical protein